jgi:hypothetical protein
MLDPMRRLLAVLGATLLVGVIDEVLAQTLVRAVAAAPPLDLASYLAVLHQPPVLQGTLAAHVLVALMAGYVAAKTARVKELRHAAAAAALQTAAYAWAFTTGESAALPPVWMRFALLVVTPPAMLAGALVRARAQAIRAGGGSARIEERA